MDSLVRLMGVQGVCGAGARVGRVFSPATYMPGNAVDLAGWNKQMLDVLDPDVGDQLTRVIGFRLQVFDVRDDGSVLAHAIGGGGPRRSCIWNVRAMSLVHCTTLRLSSVMTGVWTSRSRARR